MNKIRICLIVLVCIIASNNLKGQDNDSLLVQQQVWYNYIYIYMTMKVDTEVFGLGSDTVINDTSYYNVLRATGGVEIPYHKYGFIREDSGRVYYRTFPDKPDRLIYDFNVAEMDTVVVFGLIDRSTEYFFECQFVCDSILDETINEINRKVYYFSDLSTLEYNCERWISGIGSLSGLLHNMDNRVGSDGFKLSCVTSQDRFLFKRSETEPCIKIALGTQENKHNLPLVYPNPIRTDQEIRIANVSDGAGFELYDISGRMVLQEKLTSENSSLSIHLDNGFFLFRIYDKNDKTILTGKLVVQ